MISSRKYINSDCASLNHQILFLKHLQMSGQVLKKSCLLPLLHINKICQLGKIMSILEDCMSHEWQLGVGCGQNITIRAAIWRPLNAVHSFREEFLVNCTFFEVVLLCTFSMWMPFSSTFVLFKKKSKLCSDTLKRPQQSFSYYYLAIVFHHISIIYYWSAASLLCNTHHTLWFVTISLKIWNRKYRPWNTAIITEVEDYGIPWLKSVVCLFSPDNSLEKSILLGELISFIPSALTLSWSGYLVSHSDLP